MAVTLAGAQRTAFSSAGTSLTVDIPAGGTTDVVVIIAYTLGGISINLPSGWTALSTQIDVDGESEVARAFYKVFTSSGATTQAVTVTNSVDPGAGELFECLALRYSGVDTAAPIPEIATVAFDAGSGTSTTHNSVTVGAGNWSALAGHLGSTASRTPPSGWTEDFDISRFWASHREYAASTSTGTVTTTHSSSSKRKGWAWEVAAAVTTQTVVANHLGPTATLHQPSATPGAVTVTTNHLASGQRFSPSVQYVVAAGTIAAGTNVRQQAIVGGDSFVTAGTIAAGTVVHSPTVQPLAVTVAPGTLATTALYQQHVFRGDAIALFHLGPLATFLDHAVVPGPVSVAPSALASTAVHTQSVATDREVPGPTIATTVLYAPTTLAFIPLDHLGPTATVHAQLVGLFEVLAEPDEVEWGASGGFSARIDFLDASGLVIASTDDPNSRIVLVSGTVNEDRTQAVTRECSVKLLLVPEEAGDLHPLLPAKPGDPLDPRTGGAMAIYAGPIRPSGTPDYTKLGVFKITEANASSTTTGEQLDLRGLSQEHEIRAAPFWIPSVVLAGTRAVDAIVAIIVEAVPDVELTYESSAVTVPGELSWGDGDDRLTAVNELATSVAMVGRFDRDGVYRLKVAPAYGDEADQSPRWTFTEGALATVQDVSRSITDADLFNGVIVVGEPLNTEDDPVRAEVWDTRPSSPVYYDPDNPGRSLIGPRPKKVVTPLVTTVAQAEAMAAAELAKVLAFSDRISVTMAANPEVEAEDVVRVVRTTMGVDALYQVQSVTHDLLGGASEAVCVAL